MSTDEDFGIKMMVEKVEYQQLLTQYCLPLLQQSLRQLFVTADETLIKLAVDSKNNHEQNRYFEAVQKLRIARFEFAKRVTEAVITAIPIDASEIDTEHENSLFQLLSMPAEHYLANPSLAAAWHDLGLRMDAIKYKGKNGLEPVYFVQQFIRSLAATKLDVHTKMLVLRFFERLLYKSLDALVRKANQALSEQGVLPKLATAASDIEQTADNVLQKTLKGTQASAPLEEALAELQVTDIEALYDIMDALQPQTLWAQFDQPRDLLDQLKQKQLLPDKLSKDQKLLLQRLSVVQKLFQALDTAELANLPRAMLKALLLPFSRLALLDDDFLAQQQHPARQFLVDAVNVCEHWHVPVNSLKEDTFYNQLLALVRQPLEIERIATVSFKQLHAEVLVLAESQRQQAVYQARLFQESEYGVQSSEQARESVAKLLQDKLQGQSLPVAAVNFLQHGWSHVLYRHALELGISSDGFTAAEQAIDALIASFQPASSFANRQALLKQLPQLLPVLRQGLLAIDFPHESVNTFFGQLEEAHKVLASSIGDNEVDTVQVEAVEQPVSEPEPEQVIQASPEELNALKPGVLMHKQTDDGIKRWRLAAIIKHADKYIFTDFAGVKVAELSTAQVSKELALNTLQLQQKSAEFGQTLETMIHGVRDQ